MFISRHIFAFLTLAVALPVAPATPTGTGAALLEEVQDHLSQAQKCYDEGSYDMAVAHADMILVHDEITYSVSFENVPDAIHPAAEKALDQALSAWDEALKGTLRFHEIDGAGTPDVQIRFKPDVRMGKEPVAGYANWRRAINTGKDGKAAGQFTADLQIRALDLDFKPMVMEAMRHEIMHEMGHVLGLEDSTQIGNIMGPLDMRHPVDKPKPSEAKAVFDLRIAAEKIIKDSAAQVQKG